MQPKKHLEDHSKHSMDSKDGQPAPEALKALVAQTEAQKPSKHSTNRTRLRRARGLVRPEIAGLLIGAEYSRVGNNTWMYPTYIVSTRIAVELVEVQRN